MCHCANHLFNCDNVHCTCDTLHYNCVNVHYTCETVHYTCDTVHNTWQLLCTLANVSVTLYRLILTLSPVNCTRTLYKLNVHCTLYFNTIQSSECSRCNVNTRNKRPNAGANWLFTPPMWAYTTLPTIHSLHCCAYTAYTTLHCLHYTTLPTLHYTAYPTLPTLLCLHCCTISIWLPMFL